MYLLFGGKSTASAGNTIVKNGHSSAEHLTWGIAVECFKRFDKVGLIVISV